MPATSDQMTTASDLDVATTEYAVARAVQRATLDRYLAAKAEHEQAEERLTEARRKFEKALGVHADQLIADGIAG